MRTNVNILWLEDKLTGANRRPHENRVKCVETHVESKGYKPNIKVVQTIDEAREVLEIRDGEHRYDFFISDFDLGGGVDAEKGLDYLVSVRESNNYKRFFILYSRNEYSTISGKVSEKLRSEQNINIFTNFSFISIAIDDSNTTNDIEKKFRESLDMGLSRWDELNAVRGMYMSEHAELEFKLEQRGCYGDYDQKIAYFCQREAISEEIQRSWDNQRKVRNALAHVRESFDHTRNTFFIQSTQDSSVKIYENNLDSHRADLVNLRDSLRQFLD
ncbi:TPA: hypothetical protein U1C76_000632 [Streptococcus suis]|nr:hypothetical protein [Streptococcus suis]